MFNIAEYLHHLEIKKGHVIGDLGCGIGKTAQLLAKEYPDSTVVAVDIDEEALERFRHLVESAQQLGERFGNLQINRGDLEEDGTIQHLVDLLDVAIVENLFNTIKNKKLFLLNLNKMLKDGGVALVSDLHTTFGKNSQHQQMLTPQKDVERMLGEAGFVMYPITKGDAKHHYAYLAKKLNGRRVQINKKS